jgi:hypothetical protein
MLPLDLSAQTPLVSLGCVSIALTNAPQGTRHEQDIWGQEEPLPHQRSAELFAWMLKVGSPVPMHRLSAPGAACKRRRSRIGNLSLDREHHWPNEVRLPSGRASGQTSTSPSVRRARPRSPTTLPPSLRKPVHNRHRTTRRKGPREYDSARFPERRTRFEVHLPLSNGHPQIDSRVTRRPWRGRRANRKDHTRLVTEVRTTAHDSVSLHSDQAAATWSLVDGDSVEVAIALATTRKAYGKNRGPAECLLHPVAGPPHDPTRA